MRPGTARRAGTGRRRPRAPATSSSSSAQRLGRKARAAGQSHWRNRADRGSAPSPRVAPGAAGRTRAAPPRRPASTAPLAWPVRTPASCSAPAAERRGETLVVEYRPVSPVRSRSAAANASAASAASPRSPDMMQREPHHDALGLVLDARPRRLAPAHRRGRARSGSGSAVAMHAGGIAHREADAALAPVHCQDAHAGLRISRARRRAALLTRRQVVPVLEKRTVHLVHARAHDVDAAPARVEQVLRRGDVAVHLAEIEAGARSRAPRSRARRAARGTRCPPACDASRWWPCWMALVPASITDMVTLRARVSSSKFRRSHSESATAVEQRRAAPRRLGMRTRWSRSGSRVCGVMGMSPGAAPVVRREQVRALVRDPQATANRSSAVSRSPDASVPAPRRVSACRGRHFSTSAANAYAQIRRRLNSFFTARRRPDRPRPGGPGGPGAPGSGGCGRYRA